MFGEGERAPKEARRRERPQRLLRASAAVKMLSRDGEWDDAERCKEKENGELRREGARVHFGRNCQAKKAAPMAANAPRPVTVLDRTPNEALMQRRKLGSGVPAGLSWHR